MKIGIVQLKPLKGELIAQFNDKTEGILIYDTKTGVIDIIEV